MVGDARVGISILVTNVEKLPFTTNLRYRPYCTFSMCWILITNFANEFCPLKYHKGRIGHHTLITKYYYYDKILILTT